MGILWFCDNADLYMDFQAQPKHMSEEAALSATVNNTVNLKTLITCVLVTGTAMSTRIRLQLLKQTSRSEYTFLFTQKEL